MGLIEIAMQYLIDAMDWRAEFNGKLRRNEIPEVPVDALREAVVNAFAHRQIESGQSIQIMIYKNRIEIYSPGTFPEKNLKKKSMDLRLCSIVTAVKAGVGVARRKL